MSSWCHSGMLSGTQCRGAAGFIGSQGMTGLDPTSSLTSVGAVSCVDVKDGGAWLFWVCVLVFLDLIFWV